MKLAARRRLGVATGIVLGAAALGALCAPGCEHLHAAGPMNVGHAVVACAGCHREAPGTMRQQLQAAARSWTGLHDRAVDVGFQPVTSRECTECHDRPDDRHPGFRFLEPRFNVAREELHPERCESCHREHSGVRITVAETTYCRHCHGELVVENDPLDVSHATLVAGRQWGSCLGCHDYHGNHAGKPPRRLADAIPVERIEAYFVGGRSPYGPLIVRAIQPEDTTP
jgi:hypothetical protein